MPWFKDFPPKVKAFVLSCTSKSKPWCLHRDLKSAAGMPKKEKSQGIERKGGETIQ